MEKRSSSGKKKEEQDVGMIIKNNFYIAAFSLSRAVFSGAYEENNNFDVFLLIDSFIRFFTHD